MGNNGLLKWEFGFLRPGGEEAEKSCFFLYNVNIVILTGRSYCSTYRVGRFDLNTNI